MEGTADHVLYGVITMNLVGTLKLCKYQVQWRHTMEVSKPYAVADWASLALTLTCQHQ